MRSSDLLLTLPERGWHVVRLEDPWPLLAPLALGWIKAQRAGPGRGVYEVRLTGKGRVERAKIRDERHTP